MVKAKIDLKLTRVRKGLFQREIANAIGITVSSFSQIELGNKPTSGKTAKSISDFLGKSIDELFTVSIKGE